MGDGDADDETAGAAASGGRAPDVSFYISTDAASGRPRQRAARRAELLDRLAGYVLENGISNLTLRAAAQAAGSNNRMLLYYFGSREQLVIAALEAANDRFPEFNAVLDVLDETGRPIGERMLRVWSVLADPVNLPFHRLFFEVLGIAGFERADYVPLLGAIGTEWVERVRGAFLREGASDAQATTLAHEVVALWRGLQVTLITSGDTSAAATAAEAATRSVVARLRAG